MAITFVISSLPNESFPANVPRKKGKQKKRAHAKREDRKKCTQKNVTQNKSSFSTSFNFFRQKRWTLITDRKTVMPLRKPRLMSG